MININFRDPRPIYEQVRDGFIQLILSGVLPADYKMPSVRELASQLTINPNTIQRAYRELENDGYICTVPGRGSFVSSEDGALLRRREELKTAFREAVRKLREAGFSEEELAAMLKGGDNT